MTQRYFALGPLAGTPHVRWAVLGSALGGVHRVIGVQVSRPEGVEVERPARLAWPSAPVAAWELKRPWFNTEAIERPRVMVRRAA